MASRPRTILVAIDDAVLRLDIESAFSGLGHRVVWAGETQPALPEGEAPALALIDVDPVEERRLSLAREVAARQIPLVLFTADDGDAMLDRELAAADRLSKPFASDQLMSRVARMLARHP